MTFWELFQYPFMQRALIAAAFTGVAAPAVGTYLVQRRLSLMGDGIGHVAVTGVALGLVTGTSPTWTAVVICVLGAILIEAIRARGHTNGDVALALLFYGGLAGGVLLSGLGGESAAQLQEYLFGSILSISITDVIVTMTLSTVVLVIGVGLSPQLFAVAQDQEFARVTGLRVSFYNVLVAVLAAVSVSVAMRTVGLLLVSALMVVPVATSQQFARGFRDDPDHHRAGHRRRTSRGHDRAGRAARVRGHLAGRDPRAAPAPGAGAVPGGPGGRARDRGRDARARARPALRPRRR